MIHKITLYSFYLLEIHNLILQYVVNGRHSDVSVVYDVDVLKFIQRLPNSVPETS